MGPHVHVPPGYSPPFQVVDELHHGAWVIIIAALGLVLSLVSFLIRLYVRLVLHPPFGKDDYVLLGATIIAVVQATLLFEACSEGLGTSIVLLREDQVHLIQRLVIISDIFYLVTLYTTKCSVIGIYLRLTPQKGHKFASYCTLILCTLWVIPAILIIAVNCGFNRPWTGARGQCENLIARWQFVVALDIATELILFGLAVMLLAGLFMPLKRKLTIAFAFIFRLPMIIFAIFHIHYLQKDLGSSDPTLNAVPSILWGQAELNYALVACSVLCLRPFMAAVSTNYGTAGESSLEDASKNKSSGSNTVSGNGFGSRGVIIGNETVAVGGLQLDTAAFAGSHKGAKARESRMWSPAGEEGIELVDQGRGGSMESGGSAKMIIRKDVQYTVEYGGKTSSARRSVGNGLCIK
ncbi:hypothetical protein BJX61DRAFT_312157 [Aspergillus egyptiacus]|nr:hypothetical protein BJX61DRAFT_312157 [Aspergillus egyptiacus]